MTAVLERPVDELPDEAPRPAPAVERPSSGFGPQPELTLLALAFAGAYAGLGWWLRFEYNWYIRDAIARSANGLFAFGSHDPHLGAIGFYWPPLGSALHLPFLILLRPFHHAEYAGILSTAACGALCVYVVGRMARRWGFSRWTAFAAAAALGLNPPFVIYAASGMSEVPGILFVLLALGALIDNRRTGRPIDLAICGLSLAGLVMVRTEGFVVVVVIAALEFFRIRKPRTSFVSALLVAGPPAFAVFLWLAAQRILLGDALFFLHQNVGTGFVRRAPELSTATGRTPGLFEGDPLRIPATSLGWPGSIRWAGAWALAVAPGALVVALAVPGGLFRALRAKTDDSRDATPHGRIPGTALLPALGTFGVLAAVNANQMNGGHSLGDARYFLVGGAAIVPALLALRLVAAPPIRVIASLVATVVIAGSAVTSFIAFDNADRTYLQREYAVLGLLSGRQERLGDETVDVYRQVAKDVDPRLAKGERMLTDFYTNALYVFCDHRNRIIQPSDRDFEFTVENPTGITLAAVIGDREAVFFQAKGDRIGDLVRRDPGWKVWKQYGDIVTIYELPPAPAGTPSPTPAGVTPTIR